MFLGDLGRVATECVTFVKENYIRSNLAVFWYLKEK